MHLHFYNSIQMYNFFKALIASVLFADILQFPLEIVLKVHPLRVT